MKINRNISFSEKVKEIVLLTFLSCILFSFASVQAQKEQENEFREAEALLSSAENLLKNDQFSLGEADYRKAIALNPKDETGKYNLGNAYYGKELNAIAMERYIQAAAIATDKPNKHKAFHNLGNTFMNEKKYQEAVEAYKNALRNNPTDNETRYNLALAKKMLEEEKKEGDGDGDDKEKDDKEEKEDQENKDKNKEEEKDKDKKNEGDEGDEGDKEEEEKDKGDQKDEEKEGDKEKENGEPEDKKEEQQQQQPVPGKLSPQQIKSLLEAMNNEEKKIQEKINAKKQKGAKVKSNKDW
jgi:Ca-activated chloride channel family protein